ncbi:hypothetical protein SAMN05660653_02668 [Desulfonatronum thiosulfatophilum]|uniref:Uncharacterized protein n=1 Tax=Desulfonatronum thiosulfatophilum TaxID=617002 RepID=A0A1G6E8L4_9BACT|nr:hypothetical protein [Desulfonatronum thiosulfatophilum]SDB53702.1 hypothetical protein SAMN05660653_02668 [Desulfonatronum thiosulfatophilum]
MTDQEYVRAAKTKMEHNHFWNEDLGDSEQQPESQAIEAIREHARSFEKIRKKFIKELANKDKIRNQYLRYLLHSAKETEKSYPSQMTR